MGRCVNACSGNQSCELNCLNAFKTRQIECPCEVGSNRNISFENLYLNHKANCINGCPCTNYPCPDTTTTVLPTTTADISRTTITTEIFSSTEVETTITMTTTRSTSVNQTTNFAESTIQSVTTTPSLSQGSAVLVLNSRKSSNKPYVGQRCSKKVLGINLILSSSI